MLNLLYLFHCLIVNRLSYKNRETKQNFENCRIPDGLLKSYDQHEDSVYCAEWSNVDPWLFASLSYDGRMCINRVPKEYKLKLLMNSNY